MPHLAVAGMLTHDTIWQPRPGTGPANTLMIAEKTVRCLGGKGFVAAAAAIHCGLVANLIGFTAPETHAAASDRRGVTLPKAFCVQAEASRTWTMLSDGQDAFTIVHESAAALSNDVQAAASSLLTRADGLYLTTESAGLLTAVLDVVFTTRPEFVAVNLNAATLGDPQVSTELISRHMNVADLLVTNESEERQALDRLAAQDWASYHADHRASRLSSVVITLGKRGCRWAQRPFHQWHHRAAPPVESVTCTLGAGDTFAGALASQMILTGDLRVAINYAQHAAAAKIARLASSL